MDISVKPRFSTDYYFKSGEFADVWLGDLQGEKGSASYPAKVKVVVKVLRGVPYTEGEIQKTKHALEDAARTWKALKHPNILTCYGLEYRLDLLPALVNQFCPDGNIVDHIASSKPDNERMLILSWHVACGLEYLHSSNIIHGDLRGANVLVENGVAKLSDYGLTFVIDHSEFTTNKVAGPARWTAPEVLDPPSENENEFLFSKKSDVFAFSMTVIEMYTYKRPFHETKSDISVMAKILEGTRPDIPESLYGCEELRELLKKCWHEDPKRRPDAKGVLHVLEELKRKGRAPTAWDTVRSIRTRLRHFARAESTNNCGSVCGTCQ